MGPRKNQEGLQQLPWASDNYAAVWRLVSALEEPDNRRKLFGKNPSEVKCIYSMLDVHLAHPNLVRRCRTHLVTPGGSCGSGVAYLLRTIRYRLGYLSMYPTPQFATKLRSGLTTCQRVESRGRTWAPVCQIRKFDRLVSISYSYSYSYRFNREYPYWKHGADRLLRPTDRFHENTVPGKLARDCFGERDRG